MSASQEFIEIDKLLDEAQVTETDNLCKAVIYIYARQGRGIRNVFDFT